MFWEIFWAALLAIVAGNALSFFLVPLFEKLKNLGYQLLPVLALVVLLGAAGGAQAQCVSPDMLRARADSLGHKVVELAPAQRAAAAAKFNAVEPKTDIVFSHALVVKVGQADMLVGFVDGCLEVAQPLPRGWLEDALGKSAAIDPDPKKDGGGGGGWLIPSAQAAPPGAVAADVWGKGDYVLLMFLSAFGGPLLMWFGLRALDKSAGFRFKYEVKVWDPAAVSMYLSFRWLGAAFVLGMWLLGLGIALAS